MPVTRFRPSAGLLVAAAALLAAPASRADQIDRALVRDSKKVAAAVESLGAKNVAVLKFRVDAGDGKPSFAVGTEGADMVRRLENTLILTADAEKPAINVLAGAGGAAADLARAGNSPFDWTTATGRAKFFELVLPLAWDGREQLAPDAYVTGTVRATSDLKEVFVDLVGFTRADPATLRPLFTLAASEGKGVRVDRTVLAGLGQTFSVVRGPAGAPKGDDLFAADDSASADAARRNQEEASPAPAAPAAPVVAATPPGPVKLEVFVDGSPVPLQADASSRGEFKVAQKTAGSPATGQKVHFALTNTSNERLAALLCVNGRNTVALEGEDLASPDKPKEAFRMWVLEPGQRYEVRGFLKGLSEWADFEVATARRSAEQFDAMSPTFRGKIQLLVYGKAPLPPAPVATASGATSVATAARAEEDPLASLNAAADTAGLGSQVKGLAQSRGLAAAQASLKKQTKLAAQDGQLAVKPNKVKSRELILPGETRKADAATKVVAFKYDPNPLDSVVVTYYAPESADPFGAKP